MEGMKTMFNGYVSVSEAAKLLEVDPSQVRKYCAGRGLTRLPATKFGKFWMIKLSDLETFEKASVGNPAFTKAAPVKKRKRR